MTPDEKYIYSVAQEGMVAKLDMETGGIVKFYTLDAIKVEGLWNDTVLGPGALSGIAMGSDGYLYIGTDRATPGTEATIWKIDTRTDEVAAVIPIPGRKEGPHMNYTPSKDGRFLYFGSLQGSYAAVVDTAAEKVIRIWDDGAGNHCAFGSPDGKYIWIPNDSRQVTDKTIKALDRTFWIIDTQTNERVKILGPVPSMPHWVSFSADGRFAATESRFSDIITIWDAKNLKKLKDIAVANLAADRSYPMWKPPGEEGGEVVKKVGAWHPRLSPDGKYIYLSVNYMDANQIIDLEAGKVLKTIPVGPKPHQPILYWPGKPFATGWWTHTPPAASEANDSL
jgi:DNA-binding beta-propeller fold protein YncE